MMDERRARVHAGGALRCPCGTAQPPRRWRSGSKSFFYTLRCPLCGRRGSPATLYAENLVPLWNEMVTAERLHGENPP